MHLSRNNTEQLFWRILRVTMRRMLSISMTVLLGFLLAAPLFADPSSSLPVCCRRNGLHHCSAWMESSAERSFTTVGARCPAFPKATAAPTLHEFAASAAVNSETPLFVHPTAAPQTQARYRIAFARFRQKRGPPSAALAS
jgi:hypothetical protein